MKIMDGLKSLIGNLGNPERDKAASLSFSHIAIDDSEIIAAYSGNWIAKKIVDIPAKDALRKWRKWGGDHKDVIEAEERRLGLKAKVLQAATKARLFGGAAIYIGTNQKPSEPLNSESIRRGGVEYLTVLTRLELQAGELEQDPLSELYGKPKSYSVSGVDGLVDIHPSRLVLFLGDAQADAWTAAGVSHGWGESVLQSTTDAIKNAGGTFSNVASLVFEANIDVISIPGLMANAGSLDYEKNIVKRFAIASANKGINGTLILDKDEEYNRKSTSFAQLPDIMKAFALHCASAADIPATRFLGQSASGLSSTGEGDMDNYHDKLQSMQTLDFGPAMHLMDQCLVRSALGKYPKDTGFEWVPLKQMSEKELADIGKTTADSLKILSELDAFTGEEIRALATHKLSETGAFPHIQSIIENTTSELANDSLIALDAKPKTLYVSRKVINGKELIRWAKSQGFKPVNADDLHVTIVYSKTAINWMDIGEAWGDEVTVPEGGARILERFGDALVLLFKSGSIEWRHEEIIEAGASHDYSEYQPHITISWNDDVDLEKVEPYTGKIILGPEYFSELSE